MKNMVEVCFPGGKMTDAGQHPVRKVWIFQEILQGVSTGVVTSMKQKKTNIVPTIFEREHMYSYFCASTRKLQIKN